MVPLGRLTLLLFIAASVACGNRAEERASVPPPPTTATAPAKGRGTDAGAAPSKSSPGDGGSPRRDAASGPEKQPELPVLDLLRTDWAAVAVSSAYRGNQDQVLRLVDGDLTTAWNSASGELTKGWITVLVPRAARVVGIEMTAGFTKSTAERDLFTGNYRVRRVRISRGKTVVAEATLDTDLRTLQKIPFEEEQSGGPFKIEFIELLPGERDDWREVCISELRVLGRLAGVTGTDFTPSTDVGALPPMRPEPSVAATDPSPVERLKGVDPSTLPERVKGVPSLHVSGKATCVVAASCLVQHGFPAISADGSRIAVVTPTATPVYDATFDTGWLQTFQLVGVPGGAVEQEQVLVSAADNNVRTTGLTDCCSPGEENCDPYLCDQDPAAMAAINRNVRRQLAARIVAATSHMRGEYRPLIPIPRAGTDEAEGQTGLLLSTEIEPDAATGRETLVMRLQAPGSPRPRIERRIVLNSSDLMIMRVQAWFDRVSRAVAILVVATSDDHSVNDVRWLLDNIDRPTSSTSSP